MPRRSSRTHPASVRPNPRPYRAIAEYYDPEFAHLDYLGRDVPLLMDRIGPRPRRVLELAVGTARAAIPLAQAGHTVVGVDYDEDILAIARRKRDFVGLTPARLDLVRGDARNFRHRAATGIGTGIGTGTATGIGTGTGPAKPFDWCVILFNSLMAFTTLPDLDALLQTAHHHLKRGGRFFADIYNPDFSLLAEGESYGLDPVTFHVPTLDPETGGRVVSRTTDLADVAPQVRRVTFNYHWFKDGQEQREQITFDLAWMLPRELTLLLERNGFSVSHIFGDYDASPFHLRSPRIIVEARKR